MPRIRQYGSEVSAQTRAPGGFASAEDFGAGVGAAAARVGQAGASMADTMHDVVSRREVTDVHTKMAKANAEWTLHLNERGTAARPDDPTFASKFNDDFGKYVDSLGDRYTTPAGRSAFERVSGEMRAHFLQQSGLVQSKLAGVHATQQYGALLNSQRSALVSDPTQFDRLLSLTTEALNDPTGAYARIPAIKREELLQSTKQQMALSTVQGLTINGAAELAKRQLMEGKWDQYLDADNKKSLIEQADVALRAADTRAERNRLNAEYERKRVQEETMSTFLSRIVAPNDQNGGTLTDDEILRDPTIDSGHKQHLIDYKLRRAKELAVGAEPKTNPASVRDLMLQIHANPDDPRKTYNMDPVMEAYREGRISTPEMQMLRKEVEQLRDGNTSGFQKDLQHARQAVYTSLTRSTFGQVSPERAADAAYRFDRDLETAVAAKRAKNEDPRVLLTPGHKEYMLSPDRIQSYMRGGSAALSAAAAAAGPARVNGLKPQELEMKVLEKSPYDAMFSDAAKKHGVSMADLKRLALTESMLKPDAINTQDGNGGSFGLMQINGQHANTFKVTQEQLMDPATNIGIGAQLWKQALTAAKGDKNKAVELYKGAKTAEGRARIADQAQFITKTYKDYNSLKSGEQFLDPQGNTRTKP